MTTAYDGIDLMAMLIQEAYTDRLAELRETDDGSERILIDGWAAGLRQALALCTKAKEILNDRQAADHRRVQERNARLGRYNP